MIQLLTLFTSLTELEIKAAPIIRHEGVLANLRCQESLFSPIPSIAHLTRLHIYNIPLQHSIAQNLAESLSTAACLLQLKFSGFCSSQGALLAPHAHPHAFNFLGWYLMHDLHASE
jgi:hypothetical protein